MYSLIVKQFIRSKIAIVGLGFILLCGITSLIIGKNYLAKQQQKIESVATYQKEHIQRTVQFENKEMGLTLYYLRFAFVNAVQPINALSIGQRDVNQSIQQITIRTLEEKKYDTDLHNPSSLVLGNFDFAFVLIYLFPLLIITFCYNILSEEKEAGTWPMVATQSSNAKIIVWKKIVVRYAFVVGTLLLLYLVSIPLLQLPVNAAFTSMVAVGIGYVSFWFALSAWVISWQKNSTTNAVSLLSIWLLLTITAPAMVNNIVVNKYPIPEALGTAVANRDGYHRKWDESKEHIMEKFYAHYPQYKKYELPKKEFSWLWYYAMQQMGDDDATTQSQAMRNKLIARNNWSTTIGYFIPSIHTQLQSNAIAQSGLQNQITFLDSTTAFHEKKRLYFYPKIFEDAKVLEEDWGKHKVEFFDKEESISIVVSIIPYLLLTTLMCIFTLINFRKFPNGF
jgi:ABC-2 type transport system permease protein